MTQVLIVDDDAAVRQALADVLSEAGYAVTQATNGAQALNELQMTSTPSVVLLDYFMPGIDGHQVLQAIGAAPNRLHQHAYIFLTGEGRRFPPELNDILAERRIPTVRKPVNLDEVLDSVARAAHRLEQTDETSV
jgi:CheY-like chemotaxis protein